MPKRKHNHVCGAIDFVFVAVCVDGFFIISKSACDARTPALNITQRSITPLSNIAKRAIWKCNSTMQVGGVVDRLDTTNP